MLTVVSDSAGPDTTSDPSGASSLIDEIVREGARRMLAEALQAEVDAYIARFAGVRDENGHRLVLRNGTHAARDVLTSAGSVPVVAPRVNDKRIDPQTGERQRFFSAILPPWARKTPRVNEVLPLLHRGDVRGPLGTRLSLARCLPLLPSCCLRGPCGSPILFSTISLTPDCVAAHDVSRRFSGHAGQPADCSLISPKGNAILASWLSAAPIASAAACASDRSKWP